MGMRVQTRSQEIEAVNKALEFLTGDEARDTFSRALGGDRNPEGGKLGSRNLAKFEEKRGKYGSADNRGYKHGKYSFLQVAMESSPSHETVSGSHHNASQKLAAIAAKSG